MMLNQTTMAVIAILINIPILYLVYFHHSLARRMTHSRSQGTRAIQSAHKNARSVPLIITDKDYRIFHDSAHKTVLRSQLPHLDLSELLTLYLRRNMVKFSKLPQAWILWAMSNGQMKRTFDREYLEGLYFKVGDVICGFYEVVFRDGQRVEAKMELGDIEGRLILTVDNRGGVDDGVDAGKGKVAGFGTDTYMWLRKDAKVTMPMERFVPRVMHEIASWWLIDSGTEYLMGLKGKT